MTRTHTRQISSLVAAVLLLGAASAAAGPLTSATWVQGVNIRGIVANVAVPVTASGSATGTSAYTAFVSFPLTVNVLSTRTTTILGTFGIVASVGPGGARIINGVATTGIQARTAVKIGGLSGATLASIPRLAGISGLFTVSNGSTFFTITGHAWTTGTVMITGLSNSPVVGSGTRTFAGTNSLTPGGAGSLTLVSPTRVAMHSFTSTATANFSALTLHYAAVPEPGSLLLLASGLVGIATLAARRGRA